MTTTEASETAPNTEATSTVSHLYFEVGNDVLSKPNALCDLVEVNGNPPTAVFCNTPSDADLVEVVLKKRGIAVDKLVGHVPPMRISRAVKQVKAGELTCIVITDVSGQSIDVEELGMVINYSLPPEPEVYLHRCGQTRAGQKLTKVLSLISPLDLTNLHFLRKVVDFEINKGDLPTKEQVGSSTFSKLVKQATEAAPSFEARLHELTAQVLADSNRDSLIALLLRNTLDVLPGLQSSQSRGGERDSGGYSDDRGEGRGDRRGRGGRNNRGGNYDQDSGYGQGRDGGRNSGNRGEFRGEGMNDGSQEDGGWNGGRGDRQRRAPMPPQEKHHRLYIGQGSKDGLTAEKLTETLTKQCNTSSESIKGFKIRPHYAFVDLTEEASELVLTGLDASGGEKMFARRATVVTAQGTMPAQSAEQSSEMPSSSSEEAQPA